MSSAPMDWGADRPPCPPALWAPDRLQAQKRPFRTATTFRGGITPLLRPVIHARDARVYHWTHPFRSAHHSTTWPCSTSIGVWSSLRDHQDYLSATALRKPTKKAVPHLHSVSWWHHSTSASGVTRSRCSRVTPDASVSFCTPLHYVAVLHFNRCLVVTS